MSEHSLSLLERLVVALVPRLLKIVARTWRVDHGELSPVQGKESTALFAHWHGDMFGLLGAFGDRDAAIMVSQSKDGELLSQVVHRIGYRTVRGSSSRGGARALKSLIDQLKTAPYQVGLAGDGPRGPVHRLKPGILQLAQYTGRPVVPVGMAARWRIAFPGTWDHSYLPLPFTRCVAVFGDAVTIPRRLDAEEFEARRAELEATMRRCKHEAERRCGRDCDLDRVPEKEKRREASGSA